jgi:hypothetical protein
MQIRVGFEIAMSSGLAAKLDAPSQLVLDSRAE